MKRALLAFVFLVALFAPAQAFAAHTEYSIDQLSTDLYVETNASIRVIQRQVLTFSEDGKGLVWYLHELEEGESVKISSVRVVPLVEGEAVGEWVSLQLVSSDPNAQGTLPGDTPDAALRGQDVSPWYSYGISDGMARCYFPASPGTYVLEVDYTISNYVDVYRDIGELHWRYANSDMPVDAHDVSLRIALPASAHSEIEPNSTVVAWGHGPSDGTFAIGEDGSVAYQAGTVPAGHYAEAHVIFPAHWLENVEPNSPKRHAEARRPAAIAEEVDWIDVSARASIWDNKVRTLFMPLIVIAALAAIVCATAFGRTSRTRRWFVRIVVTLLIIAVAEQAFFREPVTTAFLVGTAVVVLMLALLLPRDAEDELEAAIEDAVPDGSEGGPS